MKTFSIVIPTRNRRESLRRLLESIGRVENFKSALLELIVVNNGSEDGTAALLAEDSTPPPGVSFRALTEPRRGKARSLNLGLSEAKGDFVLVLDDDVVVDPQLVDSHLQTYAVTPFDAIQGRVLPGVDLLGKPADPRRLREYNIPLIDYGDEICEIRGLTGTNMSFKREVFEKVGLFDVRLGPGAAGFSEDTEYSTRIRQAGFKIGYAPNAIVYHELDPGRYGRAYNRMVEFRKGLSRSLYRHDSIVFNVVPNLVANCLRFGLYSILGKTQKAYKTEGRIMKCWGYVVGKTRRPRPDNLSSEK